LISYSIQTRIQPSSTQGSLLLGLLGIILQDLNLNIGIGCSPISVVGVGGNACTATPVCCQNNNFVS